MIEGIEELDSKVAKREVVEAWEDKGRKVSGGLAYLRMKRSLLLWPRDFLTSFIKHETPEGVHYLVANSVSSDSHPPRKGWVRGHIDFDIWEARDLPESGGCSVTRLHAFHLRGSVPKLMNSLAVRKSGLQIAKVKKTILKQ